MVKAIPLSFVVTVESIDSAGRTAVLSARLKNEKGEDVLLIPAIGLPVGGTMEMKDVYGIKRINAGEVYGLEIVFSIDDIARELQDKDNGKGAKHPKGHK